MGHMLICQCSLAELMLEKKLGSRVESSKVGQVLGEVAIHEVVGL